MIALIIFLTCVFSAAAIGVMAGVADFRGMTIPNAFSALIFGLFCLCYALMWAFGMQAVFAPLLSHVLGFVVVFVVTLALFVFKVWGGGDHKLMSAFAVWFGLVGLIPFLVYTVLLGGLLGIAALVLQKYKPVKNAAEGSWIAKVQNEQGKVPYGIAIAFGALASFVKMGYFSTDTFRIFLGS